MTEPGLAALVTQLAGDAREVARSEVALAKARVGEAAERYKTAAMYFAIAGTLGLAALIALLVGLILTLLPLVGAGFATVIVVGVVMVIVTVLGLRGKAALATKAPTP